MKQQRATRIKRRMACTIVSSGERHAGIVLDVSRTGLFVQTGTSMDPGASVVIELAMGVGGQPLQIEAQIARRMRVPQHLTSVARGGIGLRIQRAPEDYFNLVARCERDEASKRPAAPTAPAPASAAPVAAAPASAPPASVEPANKSRFGSDAERAARIRKLWPDHPPTGLRRFRLRVASGSRSRWVEVVAADAEDAGRRALLELGAGWRVQGCEEIEAARGGD